MSNGLKVLRNSTRTRYRVAGGSSLILVAYLCLVCFANPSIADVTCSGDVTPSDPESWTGGLLGTTASIGGDGVGTVSVTGQSDIFSRRILIGRDASATGTATVDGAGATWTNDSDDFSVGEISSNEESDMDVSEPGMVFRI